MKTILFALAVFCSLPALSHAEEVTVTPEQKEEMFQVICVNGGIARYAGQNDMNLAESQRTQLFQAFDSPDALVQQIDRDMHSTDKSLGQVLGVTLEYISYCGPAILVQEVIGQRSCVDSAGTAHSAARLALLCHDLDQRLKNEGIKK